MTWTLGRRPRRAVARVTFAAALGMAATTGAVTAAPRAEKQAEAKSLVAEALHAEVFGDAARRTELLDKAGTLAPNLDEPHWHSGQVKIANKWVGVDEVPGLLANDLRVAAYDKKRAAARDTVEDQFALADWCAEHKMPEQERAHLTRVLALQTDNVVARTRLGFLRVGQGWVSAEEIRAAQADQAADTRSIAAYGKDFEKLAADLSADTKLRRDRAKAEIAKVRAVDAIPALERIISPVGEEASLLVVEVLGRIVAPEAAKSLARHAVLSSHPNVRAAASSALKDYELEEFVPGLLATMSDPIQTQTQLVNANGRLFYRHLLSREGQDSRDVLVMDTAYTRTVNTPYGREDAAIQAMTDATRQRAATEMAVAGANTVTKEVNERISGVLTTVTGEAHQAPADWWQWWNDHNEVFQSGEKQTRITQQARQVSLVDQGSLIALQGAAGGLQTYDCLAAGTQVWTSRGPVAIETVAVGDLVLSQNVETGELAYKPVLRTTLRPESRLTKITVDGKELLASGGHPLWVAGEGWVKARDLASGMELHTPKGPATIDSVEAVAPQVTYNLVVADFNTYFVGESRVLNHDNTVATPTAAVVPGLIAR